MKTIKKKHKNINKNKIKYSLKKKTRGGGAKEDFFKPRKDPSGNLVTSELSKKVFNFKRANNFLDLVKRGGIQFREIPEEYMSFDFGFTGVSEADYKNQITNVEQKAKTEAERVDIMDRFLLKKLKEKKLKKGGYIDGNKLVSKQYGGKIGK